MKTADRKTPPECANIPAPITHTTNLTPPSRPDPNPPHHHPAISAPPPPSRRRNLLLPPLLLLRLLLLHTRNDTRRVQAGALQALAGQHLARPAHLLTSHHAPQDFVAYGLAPQLTQGLGGC